MKHKYKITTRRKILFSLCIILIFNLLSLIIWAKVYILPTFNEYKVLTDNLTNKITNTSFHTIDNLTNFLNDNNIDYEIYNADNTLIESSNISTFDYLFTANIIELDNEKVYLKSYKKEVVNLLSLYLSFIKIQLLIELCIIIITYIFFNRILINPIEKIINDIKNYKYGKKPYRNKVITELDSIQNEFVSLTEALDENNEEKNRIIASISHDIKTPLTSIIGYSELIREESDINTIKEYNDKIIIKSKNIKEITNNFDEYLVNNSNNTIKLECITIKDLTDILINDYKVELELNGIDFLINSNCDKEVIECNISKIKRVFSNLISNSVRYIKYRGSIIIDINKIHNKVNFKVSDNGSGIDDNIIDKIFDPLYTTDPSRKISGLGLSIVKEVILFHNGDIRAYNNDRGGLTIEFNLPIKSDS